MLETVMTINIAEFEHFYSVEENNYLTRWGKRIKKRGDLITLLLAAGFVTEAERNGWKWTLGQTSCRFSPPTTFCKKEKNWNQFQEFVNWCQFGGDLTAEFFKAANRHWLIDFSLHVDGMVGLVNVQKHSITFSIIWFYGLNIPFIHCQPILSSSFTGSWTSVTFELWSQPKSFLLCRFGDFFCEEMFFVVLRSIQYNHTYDFRHFRHKGLT